MWSSVKGPTKLRWDLIVVTIVFTLNYKVSRLNYQLKFKCKRFCYYTSTHYLKKVQTILLLPCPNSPMVQHARNSYTNSISCIRRPDLLSLMFSIIFCVDTRSQSATRFLGLKIGFWLPSMANFRFYWKTLLRENHKKPV